MNDWMARREAVHDEICDLLFDTIECGAFDGGCVVVAEAMGKVFGGEVVVLVRSDGGADHAAVLKGGLLGDYDGWAAPDTFIERFNTNEMAAACSYRPIQDGDLPGAPRDPELVDDLVKLFEKMMSATPDLGGRRTPIA